MEPWNLVDWVLRRPPKGTDQIPPKATAARGRTSPVPAQRLCAFRSGRRPQSGYEDGQPEACRARAYPFARATPRRGADASDSRHGRLGRPLAVVRCQRTPESALYVRLDILIRSSSSPTEPVVIESLRSAMVSPRREDLVLGLIDAHVDILGRPVSTVAGDQGAATYQVDGAVHAARRKRRRQLIEELADPVAIQESRHVVLRPARPDRTRWRARPVG